MSTDAATSGVCLRPTSHIGSVTSAAIFIAKWSFPRDWSSTPTTSTPHEESPSTVANTTRGDLEEFCSDFVYCTYFFTKKVSFQVCTCYYFLCSLVHLQDITSSSERRGNELNIFGALAWHVLGVVLSDDDDDRQDETHLHHDKVFSNAAASTCRERVRREFFHGWEGQFFGDPVLGNVLIRLRKVLT